MGQRAGRQPEEIPGNEGCCHAVRHAPTIRQDKRDRAERLLSFGPAMDVMGLASPWSKGDATVATLMAVTRCYLMRSIDLTSFSSAMIPRCAITKRMMATKGRPAAK